MNLKLILLGSALVVSLSALGCGQTTLGQAPYSDVEWTTYTSPDKRISFDHPANLTISVRPRQDEYEPQLALSMASPDQAIDVTLMVRVSEEPLPDYCRDMVGSCADASTFAVSEAEPLKLGGGEGYRQEFQSGSGPLAVEFVAVALEAPPSYVIISSGYLLRKKADLRPICERIINSLTIRSVESL